MKRKKSFRHHSNLRNEAAMMRLRIAHGATGYGIYFMLMEHLYQSGKPLNPDDADLLAYEFHVEVEQLRSILQDFNLFALTPDGYLPQGEQPQEEPTQQEPPKEEQPQEETSQEEQPAIPTPSADSIEPSDAVNPSNIAETIDEILADKELYDEFWDELGDRSAFVAIIDSIVDEGRTYGSRQDVIRHIRAKIAAHLIDHPKPVYKRRDWC